MLCPHEALNSAVTLGVENAMTRMSHVSAVHNEERWLEAMVQSWLRQSSGRDAELVLVDDHSDDATSSIGERLAGEYERVRFFSSSGQGRRRGKVAAFNLGIERATGDFIGLIAGDDTFPADALSHWFTAVEAYSGSDLVVAFGRLRTMSSRKKEDGLIIPRKHRGNRSGGTSLFSRALAQIVFPIPEQLQSEDTWTAFALEAKASVVIELSHVVLNYRIHRDNSNPRNKDFPQMSTWMERQSQAFELLLDCDRLSLSAEDELALRREISLEGLRQSGAVLRILMESEVPPRYRMRAVAMSRPSLWRLRQVLFRYLSGW